MLIQADNGFYYENPILGSQWWKLGNEEKEDRFVFSIVKCGKNKLKRLRIANLIGRGWFVCRKNKDWEDLVDFGRGVELCRQFDVDIVNAIPIEMLISYDGRFDQSEVEEIIRNGRGKSILRFRWEYKVEEIMKLMKGEMKSDLFESSNHVWYIKKKIKEQLGISSMRELKQQMYWLGKSLPDFDMRVLKSDLFQMFGVPIFGRPNV